MSNQERATVVALITNLLVNTYAIVRVSQLYTGGALVAEDAVMVWAQAVVWVIPAAILLTIVLNIAFRMADKERGPQVVDERDQKFRLRGMVAMIVFVCLGYTAMLTTLAIGWPTILALNILFFATAFGDLVGNVVRLGSYRIGA